MILIWDRGSKRDCFSKWIKQCLRKKTIHISVPGWFRKAHQPAVLEAHIRVFYTVGPTGLYESGSF
jgi:hypothetical protein